MTDLLRHNIQTLRRWSIGTGYLGTGWGGDRIDVVPLADVLKLLDTYAQEHESWEIDPSWNGHLDQVKPAIDALRNPVNPMAPRKGRDSVTGGRRIQREHADVDIQLLSSDWWERCCRTYRVAGQRDSESLGQIIAR